MAYVNIFTSDRGWILEHLANQIANRLPYVRFTGVVDPKADIQYYMTYSAWNQRISPVEVGYFAHQEQDPETARRFLDVATQLDHCVCHAKIYEKVLRSHGVVEVSTIAPGVDQENFKPSVKIGVVGRTYHTGRKGEGIVQAVMDLPYIEWHFTGTGWPGPARHVSSEDMPAFYNEMDYILVPALYEGGPMSVVEAIACGTPVIAPPIGWVPEFPHIEFKTGDVDDLRRVLTSVVAERMSLRSSALAYSWDRWAEGHDTLFSNLATKNGLGLLSKPAQTRQIISEKIILALHGSERTSMGGPSVRVPRMAARMRSKGHKVQSVYLPDPAIMNSDIVHCFNVWSPNTALDAARQIVASGKKLVFSPIFLDLSSKSFWGNDLIKDASNAKTAPELSDRLLDTLSGYQKNCRFKAPEEAEIGFYATVGEILSLSQHVVFLSEHERKNLASVTKLTTDSTIIRNPTDTSWADAADPELIRAQTGFKEFVLCVARVEPRKNQLLLLEALKQTKLPVVLIGAEPNPEYSQLLDFYAGDRVRRLGRIPTESPLLASAYAAARVVALPSWAEGAPLAALEAAATGANLVLSNQSSEQEYFGNLAEYCDPADVMSIQKAVLRSWDAPLDSYGRATLRNHLKENNNWSKHIEDTLNVYAQVARIKTRSGTASKGLQQIKPLLSSDGAAKKPSRLALVMDVTTLANHSGRTTGIARTEFSIAKELIARDDCDIKFIAFWDKDQHFVEVDPIAVLNNRVGDFRDYAVTNGHQLYIPTKIPLLVAGSAWLQSTHYVPALENLVRTHELQLTTVIYDLVPVRFPHWFNENYAPKFQTNLHLILQSCTNLICISENTAKDLCEIALEIGVAIPAPRVVRLGDSFSSAKSSHTGHSDLRKLLEQPGFVLAVGAIHIRKNYGFLGEVWATLRDSLGSRCPRLVIVGGVAWNGSNVSRALREDTRLRGLVVILEEIDDEDLIWLYDNALLTVYPSLYEGWGLPVAESLARGKICLSSNRASIPEIAPSITDLIDPLDHPAWVEKLHKYLFSRAAREPREAMIRATYKSYSWSETTGKIVEVIRNTPAEACKRLYGYIPGRILHVNKYASPKLLKLEGWGFPDAWGVWSSAIQSKLTIVTAAAVVGEWILVIRGKLAEYGIACWCNIAVNGIPVGRIFFFDNEDQITLLQIPSDILEGFSSIEVELRPYNFTRPLNDQRISVGVSEVSLLASSQIGQLWKERRKELLGGVQLGEYIDLTSRSSGNVFFLGESKFRAGWGRCGVNGVPLMIRMQTIPALASSAMLRLRIRVAASETHQQVILFRLLSGENILRLVFSNSLVQSVEIPLSRLQVGNLSPIAFQVIAPIAKSPKELDLGDDDEPFGVGVFDLVAVDHTSPHPFVPLITKEKRPKALCFGAMLLPDMEFASPYLLTSSWHETDLYCRRTNGASGLFVIPREWLTGLTKIYLKVGWAQDNDIGLHEGFVEILVEGQVVGRGEFDCDEPIWVEVDVEAFASSKAKNVTFELCSSEIGSASPIYGSQQNSVFVYFMTFDDVRHAIH